MKWTPLWICVLMATLTRHCAKAADPPMDPTCAKRPLGLQKMCNAAMARINSMLALEAEERLHSQPTTPNVPIAKAERDLTLCTNMKCVCSELTGIASEQCVYKGQKVDRVVRKEIRMMSNEERQRYFDAILEMKKSGAFDRLYSIHTSAVNANKSNAHNGPAFLPWHRELLKRFELELRRVDPRVALPYWDNRVEARMGRNAKYSALFSAPLLGRSSYNNISEIYDGPFAGMFYPYSQSRKVEREIGQRYDQLGYSDANYESTLKLNASFFLGYYEAGKFIVKGCPQEVSYVPNVESFHDNGHAFIDGNMGVLGTSPADPAFYLHHAFIDYWFEEFRLKQQTREQRETEYATQLKCYLEIHQSSQLMTAMEERRVINGLSNLYTDIFYQYAPGPTCSATKPDCGSEFLFCDTVNYRCVGKIVPNQNCRAFEAFDPCYNGRCVNGICQEITTTSTAQTTTTTTTTTTTSARTVTTTSSTTTTTQTTTTPTTTTTTTSARTVTTPSTTSTTTTTKATTTPFDPWIITDCKNCDVIPDEGCSDSYCARLKILGRCETKSDYMIYNCPLYCLTCESYFQAKNQGL